MIHPSSVMLTSTLILSTIFALHSSSMLILWLLMELSLMSFVPLILTKSSAPIQSASKYFLIQSLASALIIFAISFSMSSYDISWMFIMSSLFMKLGVPPFHQWLPPVANSMPWLPLLIMSTLQKIPPLALMTSILSFHSPYSIITVMIFISAFIGSLGGILQTSLRKIMTYSSMSHMSWILASSLINQLTWLMYLMLYSMILMSIMLWLNNLKLYTTSQLSSKTHPLENLFLTLSFLSLAGMPPMTGFVPKLMVLQKISFFVSFPLVTATFISLFFYLRMTMSSFMSYQHKQFNTKTISPTSSIMMSTNMIGLFIIPFILSLN